MYNTERPSVTSSAPSPRKKPLTDEARRIRVDRKETERRSVKLGRRRRRNVGQSFRKSCSAASALLQVP